MLVKKPQDNLHCKISSLCKLKKAVSQWVSSIPTLLADDGGVPATGIEEDLGVVPPTFGMRLGLVAMGGLCWAAGGWAVSSADGVAGVEAEARGGCEVGVWGVDGGLDVLWAATGICRWKNASWILENKIK